MQIPNSVQLDLKPLAKCLVPNWLLPSSSIATCIGRFTMLFGTIGRVFVLKNLLNHCDHICRSPSHAPFPLERLTQKLYHQLNKHMFTLDYQNLRRLFRWKACSFWKYTANQIWDDGFSVISFLTITLRC